MDLAEARQAVLRATVAAEGEDELAQVAERVAVAVAASEPVATRAQVAERFAAAMRETVFLPAVPTLTNAGRAGQLAACFVLYLASPRLFHAVLPRLFQPFADHPPFTLLRFDVEISPEEVFAGRPVDLAVRIEGPRVPPGADAVFLDEN